MATKEDILEQIVEEYLSHKGYFVRHNLKFLPRKDHPDFVSNQDSNHSDIDVIGINPFLQGPDRVWAVSCKSWQGGFNAVSELRAIERNRVVRGRAAWKAFRELTQQKWSEAFCDAVRAATNEDNFTYVLAVSKLKGPAAPWEQNSEFLNLMQGNPIKIITFRDMVREIELVLTRTLAATEVGRMIQLFKAANLTLVDG